MNLINRLIFSLILILGFFTVMDVHAENYSASNFVSRDYIPNMYIKKLKSNGSGQYKQGRIIRKVDDNSFVYCLQPFADIDNSQTYQVTDSDYVSVLNMSEENWNRIQLLAYYGYQYGNHTESKWYYITQVLIWRTVDPTANIFFTNSLNGTRNDNLFSSEILEIENLVAYHSIKPSFNENNIKISLGESVSLVDINNVLQNYKIVSASNVNANIVDNTLYINANGIGKGNIILQKTDIKYTVPPLVYYSPYSQDVMTTGYFDPILSNVNIQIEGGKVTIHKDGEKYSVSESCKDSSECFIYEKKENLEGIKFGLYAQEDIILNDIVRFRVGDLVSEGYTNEEGNLIFENLYLGKYFVKELETKENYILDEEKYSFELKYIDSNISVLESSFSFKNHLIKGDLIFLKTDFEGNPLQGAFIEIYSESNDLIYRGKTNEEGKIILKDIPIGKFYIIEKEAPESYIVNEEPIWFEIKENEEVIKVTMVDQKIKSTISIHKIDENEKNLEGVTIGIYDLEDNLIYEGITDENGNIVIELEYGKYYFQEISTIDGYELSDEKVYFDITEDREYIQKTLVNKMREIDIPNTSSNSYIILIPIIMFSLGVVLYVLPKRKNQKKNKKVNIN